jgi:NTP pyrophosphatase (non-canonical NTP hydrolase)
MKNLKHTLAQQPQKGEIMNNIDDSKKVKALKGFNLFKVKLEATNPDIYVLAKSHDDVETNQEILLRRIIDDRSYFNDMYNFISIQKVDCVEDVVDSGEVFPYVVKYSESEPKLSEKKTHRRNYLDYVKVMDFVRYKLNISNDLSEKVIDSKCCDDECTCHDVNDVLSMNEYQKNCMKTAIWPNVGGNLVYTSLGLSSEVGEVCSHIKKSIRDDNSDLTEERRKKLFDEIGDVLYYVAALAHECGFELEDIARRNNEKLADRMERGVIRGDGDKR